MKSRIWIGSAFIVVAIIALKFTNPAEAEPAKDAQIKHGQYLVERVGMCGDCHTPRNEKGELVMNSWLLGNVLEFKPMHPMPFAPVAPPIAGLPTYATDELAVRFLETGTNAAGKMALPPMPQYRLDHEDAVSVVAYLRSLKK